MDDPKAPPGQDPKAADASRDLGAGSHAGPAAQETPAPSQAPPAAAAPESDPAQAQERRPENPGAGPSENQPENVSHPQTTPAQAPARAHPLSTSLPASIPGAFMAGEAGRPPDESPPSPYVDDTETPRILPSAGHGAVDLSLLPDPHLAPWPAVPDADNRLSMASLASFASARGFVASSAASVTGSDPGRPPAPSRSGPTPKPSIKSMQSEASASTAPITPSSSTVSLHSSAQQPAGHQYLSPNQQQQQAPSDAPKRNPRSRAEQQRSQQQTNRSRSRARRRFSGSYATSSHSPASDRGPIQKEKEEVKPAPYGVIGVCALDSKARSKPSRNILNRLVENGEFDIVVFGDKVILDEEVENWPICDYLISFYSDGFPLDKAIAYVKARRPFCVNDVPMQRILWDRRLCLQLLDKVGVPTPPRLAVNRDGGPDVLTADVAKHVRDISGISLEPVRPATIPRAQKVELLEGGDVLGVDGSFLRKPFVEKPTSGEDHNIIIYFPMSAGGGARKLFRKIGNKSSEFVPDLNVPRAITQPDESYVYEKFMQVDNAEDVKAYTVGPSYCHAETRKSPVVDGIVRRNTHGKEIRYVTPLDPFERDVASKISLAFGQRVCGFDFLRAGGKSFVIDVNGWSFVKDNDAYYDRSSSILREIFFKERARKGLSTPAGPSPTPSDGLDTSPHASLNARDREHARPAGSAGTAPGSKTSLDMKHEQPSQKVTSQTDLTSTQKIQSSASSSVYPSQDSGATGTRSAAPSIKSAATSIPAEPEVGPEEHQAPPPPKHSWKLKGIVSVIRHADRTPKQKYKFTFHTEPFIELLKGHQEEVLLIGEPALASVKQAVLNAEAQGVEDPAKLKALRAILQKKSGLAGTKVQIKPMFRKKVSEDTSAFEDSPAIPEDEEADAQSKPSEAGGEKKKPKRNAKRQDSLSGVTMSRITAAENSLVLDKLQLIVKWGGEPTHAARYQSQELGENMRNDFKLLNREIFDEVHVYSSSERRVTTSAQIWSSAFLKKADLPEDFVSVRKDLLDDSNAAKDVMDKVKKKLKGLLREGNERPSQFTWPDKTPEPSEVQKQVVKLMKFLRKTMRYNYKKLESGIIQEDDEEARPVTPSEKAGGADAPGSAASSPPPPSTRSIQPRWCSGEDTVLFKERWEKLFAEFCDGEKVDPSKISELYDTMKFDALHNRQFLEWIFTPSTRMLEDEYEAKKDGGAPHHPFREHNESRRTSEESRREQNAAMAAAQNGEKLGGAGCGGRNSGHAQGGGGDRAEEGADPAKSVRRLFRRRSFLNGLRQEPAAPPEQYFHLYKSNPLVKQRSVDARLEPLRQLYQLAKILFDFICPQEYGISDGEKLEIGLLTSLPLLKEIAQDLEEMQASDDAKSFFYFTKESHIYTLLNCIFEGGMQTKINRSTIPELDYLSQICFELYESETKGGDSSGSGDEGEPTFAYSIRITISPGCHVPDPLDVQLDSRHCISCAPRRSLTAHVDWWKVIKTLRAKFNQVKLPKSFIAVNLSDAFSFEENENTEHETTENESDAPGGPETSTRRDDQSGGAKGEPVPEEGVPAGDVI